MTQENSIQSDAIPWYLIAIFCILLIAALPVMLVVAPFVFIMYRARRHVLPSRIADEWIDGGTDMLLIYSNEPAWKTYAEERIIPLIKDRARTLNWSERREWMNDTERLDVQWVRHYLGSGRDWIFETKRRKNRNPYNHLLFVFKKGAQPEAIHLWPAWKAYQQGNPEEMEGILRRIQELTSLP